MSYRTGAVAVFVKKANVTIIEQENPLTKSADVLKIKFTFNEDFKFLAIYRLQNHPV
jgi:hypothetical protein